MVVARKLAVFDVTQKRDRVGNAQIVNQALELGTRLALTCNDELRVGKLAEDRGHRFDGVALAREWVKSLDVEK